MENKLEKKQINVPGFMEKALETIEGMEAWAQKMIDSKLVPDHFYETKLVDNKKVPDYTRGNTAAVIVVVQNGIETAGGKRRCAADDQHRTGSLTDPGPRQD